MKILALTVAAGNGHNKAAESIKECLENNYENVEVEIFDTFKYINPVLDKLIVGSYLKSVKSIPSLYRKLYAYAENEESVSHFSQFINDILSVKLKNLILEKNPDVIYCTNPFPVEMLSILKRKGKISTPVVAILTDYAPHAFWFYNCIDAYVVPHEDFLWEIKEKGVPLNTIYPFGIPISNDFLNPVDKKAVLDELGLSPNKLTLLLMGGGLGIGNITKIYKELCFSSLDVQFIICCGKNNKLKNQLNCLKSRTLKKTVIFGYTNRIPEFMSVSDILISKPGGLTVAESLVKKLPMIITSTIPGQEEKNAEYLINNGIAAKVKEYDNIINLLYQFSESTFRLNHMKQMAEEKAKPDSTQNISKLIYEYGKGIVK